MRSFLEGCTDDPETVLLWFEMRIIRSQPPYAMGSHQTPDWFRVHGNLTPAGFATGSIEKYHYALHLSSPTGCIPGLPSYKWLSLASSREVLAHLRLRLVIQGTYLTLVYSVVKVLFRGLCEEAPHSSIAEFFCQKMGRKIIYFLGVEIWRETEEKVDWI